MCLSTMSASTAHLHGMTYHDVCEKESGYVSWIESKDKVFGANAELQQYLWAHPPAWRRQGWTAVEAGHRAPLLVVLDTETTGLPGGVGIPYKGPTAFDPEEHKNMHLLDLAIQVLDPRTMTVLETHQAYIRPDRTYLDPFDKDLYALACQVGEPCKDVLTGFMEVLRTWRTTHDVYIVCHNVAFDRKVLLYHLAMEQMFEAYFEFLSFPFLCTMKSTMACDGGAYDRWARTVYPEAYAKNPSAKFPKLERLHLMLTGNNTVQKHHALADVEMTIACLPELIRRGWFTVPGVAAPAPAPAPAPTTVRAPSPNVLRKVKKMRHLPKKSISSRPSKTLKGSHTSASKPTSVPSHSYNLRSRVR